MPTGILGGPVNVVFNLVHYRRFYRFMLQFYQPILSSLAIIAQRENVNLLHSHATCHLIADPFHMMPYNWTQFRRDPDGASKICLQMNLESTPTPLQVADGCNQVRAEGSGIRIGTS